MDNQQKYHDIAQYDFTDEDFSILNPYVKEIYTILSEIRSKDPAENSSILSAHRLELVSKYSFAIPTIDILKIIAGLSPIIEIGAGSGYWAMCLSYLGTDVIAYDKRPPGIGSPWEWYNSNQWFDDDWYHVMEGDETMASFYPDRTLFLCWPPLDSPMAYNALQNYKRAGGSKVIYIGNPKSSADEKFHDELKIYKEIVNQQTWSWPGIDERLLIYSI